MVKKAEERTEEARSDDEPVIIKCEDIRENGEKISELTCDF